MARTPNGTAYDDDSDVYRLVASSPATSFSSDKENREVHSRRSNNKRVSPMTDRSVNKRRRVQTASQAVHKNAQGKATDTKVYDPDQNVEERRQVRKGLRDLQKNFTDSKNEYMSANSKGIYDTVKSATVLFNNVKQTSDATLDSRLLVSVGELAARRAVQNKLGSAAPGVDLDEFVNKCISFMRRGPSDRDMQLLGLSQQVRRLGDDADSGDEGENLNWEWLGRKACLPFNSRPPAPSFLLGPLSVEKKVRKITQRTQRQQRHNPADALRPDEIKIGEIEKTENSNLVALCANIKNLLNQYIEEHSALVEAEVEEAGGADDLDEETVMEILDRHALDASGGVNFFKFSFHPTSFGQTVENIFYISFLIRDGQAGLADDERGILYLHAAETSTAEEFKRSNITKQQSILHLDFDIWREVIETVGITKSIIPHRVSEQDRDIGRSGWYA